MTSLPSAKILFSVIDIANELQATIKNMNVLVEDLKKNPSRYVNISVFGKKQEIQH